MYKVYTSRRGIEFRWDVKSKILAALFITASLLVVFNLETILEYMIAGF